MQEDFLFFLWKHRIYRADQLTTVCGMKLEVINPGILNTDAGPDFSFAHIRFNDHELMGQVEMHVRSSDWIAHKHHKDKSYENVILHVVWEQDREIFLHKEGDLPVLQLSSFTNTMYLLKYRELLERLHAIPCNAEFSQVKKILKRQWMDRMLVSRMELLSKRVEEDLKHLDGDWQELLYRRIGKAMGARVNGQAMELLCQTVPYSFISRYRDRRNTVEAILFGQSALLSHNCEDGYPRKLWKEYAFWKEYLHLEAVQTGVFRFMRMRPAAFPTMRIAQFAEILKQVSPISRLLDVANSAAEIKSTLMVEVDAYWTEHYRFDKTSARRHSAKPGSQVLEQIILNAIVPVMFTLGILRNKQNLKSRALKLLEELPSEQNKIMREWENLGLRSESSAESQALYHCFTEMCAAKKCLSCDIGKNILINSSINDSGHN